MTHDNHDELTGDEERTRLRVGAVVVHPGHGAGRILAREKRQDRGAVRNVVVLELCDGLLVTLPVELARRVLRSPLSQADLFRVQETLRLAPLPSEDGWLKRRRDTQLKLTRGSPIELAEVVRDGALRQQRLLASKRGAFLSASERALYTRARRLLAGEIGLVNDLEPAEADAWIDEQLDPTSQLANDGCPPDEERGSSIEAGVEASADARQLRASTPNHGPDADGARRDLRHPRR